MRAVILILCGIAVELTTLDATTQIDSGSEYKPDPFHRRVRDRQVQCQCLDPEILAHRQSGATKLKILR
jgi:hypothetical protein